MSQENTQKRNAPKLTIRNRKGAEGRITVGANTEILLDGEPIRGAHYVKVEIGAKKVAKVTVEMYAEVDMEVHTPLETTLVEDTEYDYNGKPLRIHTLTNYSPVGIARKRRKK